MRVIERLLDFLEQDIIPLIPECGSVGASGDLVPHCSPAAILIGEGKVYDKGIIRDEVAPVSWVNLTITVSDGVGCTE